VPESRVRKLEMKESAMSRQRILSRRLSSMNRPCSAALVWITAALCSITSIADEPSAEKKFTTDEQRQLDEAEQLNQQLTGLARLGNYSEAVVPATQALEIRRKILGENAPDVARSMINLASVYVAKADYARAEPLFRNALEIFKRTLNPQDSDFAASLNNLGMLYFVEGEYAQAEPLLREAMEIWKKGLGPQHASYATSLDNLAGLYHKEGDDRRAEPLLREALEIRKKIPGTHDRDLATSLSKLAQIYQALGDYKQAESQLREALAIRKNALGPKHPDYAASLSNLARLYHAQGDYPRAEPLLLESVEILKNASGPQHPDYATGLDNLGLLYQAQGDFARAEPLFRDALEIRKKALGPRHPDYARSLGNLANCKLAMHSADESLPLAREAAQIAREQLERTATIQSEQQQLEMTQGNRGYLDLFLSVSRAANAPADNTYDQILAWKGAVTDRQGFLRAMRRDVQNQPDALALYTELQVVTRQLGVAVNIVPPEQQREALRRRIEQLSQRIEELQQKMAGASTQFAQRLRQRRRTCAELRKSLPAGIAIVDLVEYTDYGEFAKKEKELPIQRRLAAFVICRDRPVVSIDLGPAERLSQAVDVWRARQLGGPAAGSPAAKRFDETLAAWKNVHADADPAQMLREWVWDKLPAELLDPGQTPTVIVSPDGALDRFPWAVLPGPKPGSYLLEEQGISVIPVARELPEILASQNKLAAAPASLLLVGDINYDGDPGVPVASAASHRWERAIRAGEKTWPKLTNTSMEVATIERRFRKRFGSERLTTLDENAATKQAIESLAPKFRYLHFATHGFFADPDVQPPAVRNNRAEMEGFSDRTRLELSRHHPGLLSGIVLTGANQPVSEDKDDGILTALEVGELELSGVDLVTLSACETGLGATAGGEGLLGLQRAFQTAGARTTVATLWKLPDEAARSLMTDMYENLWGEKKMSKLEALRQAQLSMLREGVKRGLKFADGAPPKEGRLRPYYWAAFVLSGDWR
jgi:CHAT domain-containing protein/Tfp pilus assembly protein PilF